MGPGKKLAIRNSEYGIIKIGFVGKAKNGCNEDNGVVARAGGLVDSGFCVASVVAGKLYETKI